MTFLSRSDALTRKSLEQESISTELLYISRMLIIILLRGKTAGALEIPPRKAGYVSCSSDSARQRIRAREDTFFFYAFYICMRISITARRVRIDKKTVHKYPCNHTLIVVLSCVAFHGGDTFVPLQRTRGEICQRKASISW